jgi:hypothetical protein
VNLQVLLSALAVLVGGAAAADELVLPKSMQRNQPADFAYRFDKSLTGRGSLDIEWSDVVGRLVERRRIPVDLAEAPEVVFALDLRRAAAMANQLVAHLTLDGVEENGNRYLENEVSTSFIVPSADHPWSDYQIIMWQGQTPAGYATLKKLGSPPEWCKPTTAMKQAPRCPALPVWSTPICAAIWKTLRPISILPITSGTMVAR